ncbi:hypothetical protein MTR_7g427720 [Medicago truncatula]|uniref:HD-Zip IV C-terminal domain-containing protein n=1 Tax=Medicago truncatula TaxID=3880 RepID=A0A072TWT6_MEDTR|nr:hypothetical protein MTR_7g427720 [Medicago truncatula]
MMCIHHQIHQIDELPIPTIRIQTITSDGNQNENNIQGGNSGNDDVASTSTNTNIGGSLLTVAFQIMVSSLPSKMESVPIVNGLIGKTVQHIKAALNCPM